ncbi:YobA family protein [Pontibacter sp. HSC-14F20]|uniref:YobA family protein n=1 Tax=Pontibacter sp. HSC-14F20 TaxID=2864136 RepID=UPI001C72A9A9|nr:YobA family protein [Pontibacter sp. HSC-14F20]MBX0335248.1 YobA family protein [Pontibacter sp. HSC-14F20]
MKRYLSSLPLAILFLAGCQTQDRFQIPSTQPDMRGNITNIKKTNSKTKEGVAVVLVESVEGVQTGHTKATLRIDAKTYIENVEGAALRLEHLREGQLVEAWFDEQIMESFPVEAHAAAVRVSN